MIDSVKTIVLPAKMDQWDHVYELVESCLDGTDTSEKTKYDLFVSAEEIFTNIASYAYDSVEGMVEISCGFCTESQDELRVSFKDWGTPYNPLERSDPDFDIPFEERGIGGLGIFMVKKFMDYVEYRNEHGCNIFTIGKKL